MKPRLRYCGLAFVLALFAIPVAAEVPMDFDGDAKSDLAVFRPSTGTWWVRNSSTGSTSMVKFGTSGDIPVPGDFDGDGKTDAAIFRPTTGGFWLRLSSTGSSQFIPFGLSTDEPRVVADYDGDGKADVAVWRSSSATFYVRRSSNFAVDFIPFGLSGDRALPGYRTDTSSRAHPSVYRPSNGTFYASVFGTLVAVTAGDPATDAVAVHDRLGGPGSDWTVFTKTGAQAGDWFVRGSTSFGAIQESASFGVANDLPVSGDFDGDGKMDLGVVRDNGASLVWYTTSGASTAVSPWGSTGDVVPASTFFWR